MRFARHNLVFLRTLLIAISLLAICNASWGQQTPSVSKGQAASSNVVLTEQDNGKDIDLTIGSTLVVKLPSNPSTGYNWSVVGEPSPLKLQKTSFRKNQTKTSTVGASGTSVFQLSANSSGLATLAMVYRRSWEYNVPPIKTFAVRVDVR